MKLSYSWLKDYIDCDLTPQEVADAITSIGIEVDSLTEQEEIPGGLAGVVVAKVLECRPHPNSDHLHITKVDDGAGEPYQVVCGAPNVAAGQKVLLAKVGAVLPGDFKIKKSKIRGEESFGMICAEDELGIGTDHAGIMVLPDDAVVGTPAKDYLHLKADAVIEYEITANRIDAASHWGVARDLYAWLKLRGKRAELHLPDVSAFKEGEGEAIPVEVQDATAAPKYTGLTIRGVKVGPSPEWMQKRLMAVGLNPVDNVVDVSNYVLNELGQALHTFDAGKISGGKVIVRRAKEGEKLTTLDGVERTLDANDIVICDDKGPMCLGGVFGGLDSGVTDSTTDVFLESAWFDPGSIRKTSKKHAIQTDASYRNERGADPLITEYASKRAALLILETAGGHIEGKMQEFCPKPFRKAEIDLDYDRMERLIGKKIGHDTIEKILGYLGYDFLEKKEGGARVAAPTYMVDVTRECDVVEEVLRIYGYNNVEFPSEVHISVTPSPSPEPEATRNYISNFLAANGFVETMNNSLTKSAYYDNLKTFPSERLVHIVNPLSSDLNVMRQTLILGGLEVFAYNINRQVHTMRTFEYGSVYQRLPEGDGKTLASYEEHTCFTLMMTGPIEKSWRNAGGKSSYFQLKGYVEMLLRRYGVDPYTLETETAPSDIFSEGLVYKTPGSGKTLCTLGTVSPSLAALTGVRQPVFAAEISWPELFTLIKRVKVKFTEMPKFPGTRRDLALLLDESVRYEDLEKCAMKTIRKVLTHVSLFDVYRGDKIPAGKKQYAMSFFFQNPDKTLTDQEVDKFVEKIFRTFESQFGAVLR